MKEGGDLATMGRICDEQQNRQFLELLVCVKRIFILSANKRNIFLSLSWSSVVIDKKIQTESYTDYAKLSRKKPEKISENIDVSKLQNADFRKSSSSN